MPETQDVQPDQSAGAVTALGLGTLPMPRSDAATLNPVSPDLRNASIGRAPDSQPSAGSVGKIPANAGGGENVQQAVRQEWLNAGYSPAAVEGIMRRIKVESGFDPFAIGDGGTSLSLYQHHADRATKLAKFLQENGASTADPVKTARLSTQFAIAEMNGGDPIAARARPALMHATDPKDAYGIFTNSFERPKGSPGSDETNMKATALGEFTGTAKALVDQALSRMNKDTSGHDAAMAEAKDMRSFERAAMARWMAASDKPPKNMHENWQQWGGIAQLFALVGPLFGKRSATAALNAAGEMMQAANQADQRTYDAAYKQWKDHNDSMLKAVELFHGQYKEIIESDNKSWDHKQAEIGVLLNAAGVVSRFDEQAFTKQEQALRIAKDRAELTKAQNEDSEIRLSAEAKDKVWLTEHPEAGEVPASVKNSHVGEAKRERSGTSASGAIQQQVYANLKAKYLGDGMSEADADIKAARESGIVKPSASTMSAKGQAAQAFVDKKTAETGKPPTYEDWVKFSQETAGSATGQLSPDAVKILAQQYEMGDTSVITSLPRGGPGRIQVENQIAQDLKGMEDGAAKIVMNRLRMAEARAAATTAGRVTMNTELYAQEAVGAGQQVIETSKLFPRTNYPKINEALAAYERHTGDPNIIRFGTAINALVNAYGKMSNPTGTGVHDADKERLARIMDTALSQGQVEAGVDQIIKEGRVVSSAAQRAQEEVLSRLAPQVPGAAPAVQPSAAPAPATAGVPVPAGHRSDPDGTKYKGSDGQTYVKRGDQMVPE